MEVGSHRGGRMAEGRGSEKKGGGEDPLETLLVGSAMSTMAILLCDGLPSLLDVHVCARRSRGQAGVQLPS